MAKLSLILLSSSKTNGAWKILLYRIIAASVIQINEGLFFDKGLFIGFIAIPVNYVVIFMGV